MASRMNGDGGNVNHSEDSSEDESDESEDENGRGKSKVSRSAKTLQVKDDSSSDKRLRTVSMQATHSSLGLDFNGGSISYAFALRY